MNQGNSKGKGVGLIISAISGIILAVIFFTVASDKEELRYYLDEDYRMLMTIFNAGGWVLVVTGVVEFIAGLVLIANGENEEEWANSNLVTCPDCRKSISRQAESCPHCGRKAIVKSNASVSSQTPASGQNVPTWKRIQMEEKAVKQEQGAQDVPEAVKMSVPAKKCPECGTTQSGDNRVCFYCGAEF